MNQQTDKYIKYLGKMTMLNSLRRENLITDKELIDIKRYIQNKYKIRDYD